MGTWIYVFSLGAFSRSIIPISRKYGLYSNIEEKCDVCQDKSHIPWLARQLGVVNENI